MKKFILTAIILCAALTANAQFYLGGGVRFVNNGNTDVTTFSFAPELGYNLSDQVALGAAFGISARNTNAGNTNTFSFKPYVRYTFAEIGIARFFIDGALTLAKPSNHDGTWEIGVYPGIALPLNERLSFVAHLGELSYNSGSVFTLGLENTVSTGIYYSF